MFSGNSNATYPFSRALVVVVVCGAFGVVNVREYGGASLVDADEVVSAGCAISHQPQRPDLRMLRKTGSSSVKINDISYFIVENSAKN
jgi:hypothetical protein